MTIDEALIHLEHSGFCNYDRESADVIIDVVEKYQEITNLVRKWKSWDKDNYRLSRIIEIIQGDNN